MIAISAMPSGFGVAHPKPDVEVYRIDDVLKPVDTLCELWKEQAFDWPPSGATPIYRAMKEAEVGASLPSGPPQISDNVQTLDRVLASSPRERLFVIVWYVHGGSIRQKAGRLGISRAQMYIEHKTVLGYLRGHLHARGLTI